MEMLRFHSSAAEIWALKQASAIASSGRRAVFLAIASLVDDSFSCAAKLGDVAALAGMSASGVTHHIGRLRREGFITYEHLSRLQGGGRGYRRFALSAPSLADLVATPELAAILGKMTGGGEVLDTKPLDPDDEDLHDAAVMLHADGTVTLLLSPMGELTVPEFITCMAEIRRRSALLGERLRRQVRSALATHESPNHGRVLAMVSACRQYGVSYLPLPNLIERL